MTDAAERACRATPGYSQRPRLRTRRCTGLSQQPANTGPVPTPHPTPGAASPSSPSPASRSEPAAAPEARQAAMLSSQNSVEDASTKSVVANVAALAASVKPFAEILGLVGLVSVPVAAIRILAVSNWDRSVALAILTNSSVGDLAIALVLLSFPTVLYIAAMILAMEIASADPPKRASMSAVLLLVFLIASLAAPGWVELAAGIPLPLAVLVIVYFRNRNKSPVQVRADNRVRVWYFIASSAWVLLISSQFWLPPERLVVGGQARLAYVLKDSDKEIVAYLPVERSVLRLSKDLVTERQYCVPSSRSPIFKSEIRSRPKCPDRDEEKKLGPIPLPSTRSFPSGVTPSSAVPSTSVASSPAPAISRGP
jgi:hypothetical protein